MCCMRTTLNRYICCLWHWNVCQSNMYAKHTHKYLQVENSVYDRKFPQNAAAEWHTKISDTHTHTHGTNALSTRTIHVQIREKKNK